VLGALHFIFGPWRRGLPVGAGASEARIPVEATSCPQDEYLARGSLKPPLQLDRIVARVEDEKGNIASHGGSSEQLFDLLRGYRVCFMVRTDALHAYRDGPALADEVELCDELVSPPGHDGLARGVAGRMIVVSSLRAAFCVASGPHAHIHRINGRLILVACGERMSDEQPPQSLGVDASAIQRGVEAAPAATMRRLEAQVGGRRGAAGGEDCVGKLEEGIGPTMEAFVERATEAVESVVGSHDAPILHSPRVLRTSYLTRS
jgi:hypothetical protein